MSDLAMRIIISASDSGATGTIKNVVSALSGGGSGGLVGAIAGVGIAAAGLAIGLGAASVKAAADFQQIMLQSEALANVSKQDADAASSAILQMATAMGQTPQDLAKGFYYIASTGASAKDSMIELALAAKAAAVGNTSTEVTANALTAILATYGLKAKDAARITDQMVASVASGKTEFEDYAKVIGVIATNAKQAGISFAEATSAFSSLSNVMSPKQAKDAADALLQTTSRFTVLETRAKSLGLTFDLSAYKSMNLEDRLKYLQKITGGNTEEIGKLIGRQNAMAAFTDLSANHFENYNNVLQSVEHSHGDLNAAFAKTSSGFNAAMGRIAAAGQVLLITIGNQLLPVLTKLANDVAPLIAKFADWVTQSHIVDHVMQGLSDTFKNIGAILAKIDWAKVGAALQNIGNVLANITSQGPGSAQSFKHIGDAVQFISNALSKVDWGKVFNTLWHILQQIGSFLASTFIPVWQELVTDFNQIKAALQPVMPQLRQLAMAVGVIVVGAIILAIAIIAGLIKVFAAVLIGIARFVTGAIQFLTGLWQFVQGVMNLIADIFTGKWGKIGADIDQIMQGILSMITGVLNMISGIWTVTWGAIQGFAEGFAQAIIAIFQNLADMLVGHSIVPDMLNAIVNVFATLAGRVTGPINNAVHTITSILSGAISDATNAGANIVKGIADGIQGAIHFVAGAIGNVASFISSHLPHSPAKVGPLRYLDKQGAEIVNQVSLGMLKARPTLQSHLSTALQPGGIGASGVRGGGSGGTVVNHYHITVNAPALSRREAQNLAEALDKELGHRYRSQYSSASSGAL